MDKYTQEELDQIIFAPPSAAAVKLGISRSGGNVLLSWPAFADGYGLESAGSLNPPAWTAVADAPMLAGGQTTVTVSAVGGRNIAG